MDPPVPRRPILSPLNSVNQTAPSGPVVMPFGPLTAVGTGYSVKAPAGMMRPILLLAFSVNQIAPSSPRVMPSGSGLVVGIVNSVTTPAGVIRPIFPVRSAYQTFPSDPQARSSGSDVPGIGYSTSICGGASPPMTNCAILLSLNSTNQGFPSGPVVMPYDP